MIVSYFKTWFGIFLVFVFRSYLFFGFVISSVKVKSFCCQINPSMLLDRMSSGWFLLHIKGSYIQIDFQIKTFFSP